MPLYTIPIRASSAAPKTPLTHLHYQQQQPPHQQISEDSFREWDFSLRSTKYVEVIVMTDDTKMVEKYDAAPIQSNDFKSMNIPDMILKTFPPRSYPEPPHSSSIYLPSPYQKC